MWPLELVSAVGVIEAAVGDQNIAIASWTADRGARSTTFLSGLALALAASTVFCLAGTPSVLVLARALQGFSSSVIYTAGLAIVADAVPLNEFGPWYCHSPFRLSTANDTEG